MPTQTGDHRDEALDGLFGGVFDVIDPPVQPGEEVADLAQQNGRHHRVPVRIAPVHRRAPEPGSAGDVMHRGPPDPDFLDRRPRRVQHPVTARLGERPAQGVFQRARGHVATGQACSSRRLAWYRWNDSGPRSAISYPPG